MKHIAITGANGTIGRIIQTQLAWDTKVEHYQSGNINPDNIQMTFNTYRAAFETGVPRVIMASSVHADDFEGWHAPPYLSSDRIPTPDSPYGASKVFMEALGRYYAKKGLEVVCVRFMGLNTLNKSSENTEDQRRWFSHRDCGNLMKAIIEAPSVPQNYVLMYGVSHNSNRKHDYANPFGWIPVDNAGGA